MKVVLQSACVRTTPVRSPASQTQSEFELHARAILGLPVDTIMRAGRRQRGDLRRHGRHPSVLPAWPTPGCPAATCACLAQTRKLLSAAAWAWRWPAANTKPSPRTRQTGRQPRHPVQENLIMTTATPPKAQPAAHRHRMSCLAAKPCRPAGGPLLQCDGPRPGGGRNPPPAPGRPGRLATKTVHVSVRLAGRPQSVYGAIWPPTPARRHLPFPSINRPATNGCTAWKKAF